MTKLFTEQSFKLLQDGAPYYYKRNPANSDLSQITYQIAWLQRSLGARELRQALIDLYGQEWFDSVVVLPQ